MVASPSGPTKQQWATTLLQRMRIPVTNANLAAITFWMTMEGGAGPQYGVKNNTANYNPLNTTRDGFPGATTVNSAGVKSYRSWEQGMDATVQTLSLPAYANIVSHLRSGTTGGVLEAIDNSPWGTKGLASAHRQGTADSNSAAIPETGIPGLDPVLNAAGDAVSGAASAAMAVPDFLGKITSQSFLIRAGEVVVGTTLIFVGVVQLGKVAFNVDVTAPVKAAAALAAV